MIRERSLFVHWADKGCNATIISAKKKNHFGSSAPSYSWVTKWLFALKRGKDVFEPCECPGRLQDSLAGLKVLEFLNSTQFASIR
jgi:hypothetical protein